MTLHQGRTKVHTLFIHQTTTRPGWMEGETAEAKRDEIDRWHKKRGWRGFGYHELIARDGTRAKGRPLTSMGAHVAGYNLGSIGVALEGGFGASKTDQFEDHFTPEQDKALREYIDEIKRIADIKYIRGHSEVANKACPGFTVSKWLDGKKTPPLPVKEVKAAMKQSKKYTATQCAKWGMVTTGGVSAGWPAVKEQIGIGKDMLQTFEGLIASNGLVVISGLCIVAAIVFNWLQIKQRDDFAEGRYTPSGAVE